MKNEYKMLAKVNAMQLKEERPKVLDRDTKIAELQDKCDTKWAAGYFAFQE